MVRSADITPAVPVKYALPGFAPPEEAGSRISVACYEGAAAIVGGDDAQLPLDRAVL